MVMEAGGKASTTSTKVYWDPSGNSSSSVREIIVGARSEGECCELGCKGRKFILIVVGTRLLHEKLQVGFAENMTKKLWVEEIIHHSR